MDLLEDLKAQMMRGKAAPKMRGMYTMNKSVIRSISASVLLPASAMFVAYIQNSISDIGAATSSNNGL